MAFDRTAIKSPFIKVGASWVSRAAATDAQLKAAALANPSILADGWSVGGGDIHKAAGTPSGSQQSTKAANLAPTHTPDKATQAWLDTKPFGGPVPNSGLDPVSKTPDAAKPVFDPANAFATDPWYRGQKGNLDLQHKMAQDDYNEQLGVDGAHGNLWNDWQYAMDALGRGTRGHISDTNAGLSGANLSGSGVARKSLEDIGAAYLSDSSQLTTNRTRDEATATRKKIDEGTNYEAQAGDLMAQAGERWKVNVVIDNRPGGGGQIGVEGHAGFGNRGLHFRHVHRVAPDHQLIVS